MQLLDVLRNTIYELLDMEGNDEAQIRDEIDNDFEGYEED